MVCQTLAVIWCLSDTCYDLDSELLSSKHQIQSLGLLLSSHRNVEYLLPALEQTIRASTVGILASVHSVFVSNHPVYLHYALVRCLSVLCVT